MDIEAIYVFELMNTGIHDVGDSNEFRKMFRLVIKIGKSDDDKKKFKDLFGYNKAMQEYHETKADVYVSNDGCISVCETYHRKYYEN